MSLTIEPTIDQAAFRPHPFYVRPIALSSLLMVEILFITIRFECPLIKGTDSWWALVLQHSHSIVRLVLLATVAIGTFGGFRFAIRLRRAFERDARWNLSWPSWLLAHGVAFSVFVVVTSFVCDGKLTASSRPGAWVAAWIVWGLVTGLTWASAMLSPSAWLGILSRSVRTLAMGLTVALGTFGLSGYASEFWDTMAGTTLSLVHAMLSVVLRDIICDPNHLTIGVVGFQVRIASACSGFEGIGMVVGFLAAYLWWFRAALRWPRAYLLLPIGAAAIWLLNAVRIASLILIGAWGSPTVALGGFHSQAGWIAFLAVSLGMVAMTRRWAFFAANHGDVAIVTPTGSNPSASFLCPILVIVATTMVTGAFSTGFDAFYGLRVLTGGAALWYFRRDFLGLLARGGSWAGVAVGVIAFALWVALEPASTGLDVGLASVVGSMPRGQAWAWVALRVIGSVAIIPLAEELAFRGYLTRRVISVDFESVPVGQFSWLSMLVSSAAFGMLHGRWLAGMLVGILYALALYRRGKLGDAVLAHAVTNALIAATVLATGDWTMWS